MIDQIYWIFFSIPSILIASAVHEYAHAFAAYKQGDNTARMEGRMTLNPLAHIDPIGALMMVFAKFGWSKPVPINEYNFKNPVAGTAVTAFAGPLSNLILAVLTAIPLRIMLTTMSSNPEFAGMTGGENTPLQFVFALLSTFMLVNISLAIFNLIPIPPLDGHKIVRAFLPENLRYHWENLQKFGPYLLLLLFLPFSPIAIAVTKVLATATSFLLNILL